MDQGPYIVVTAEGSAWSSVHLNEILPIFTKPLFKQLGDRVLQGPFAGMQIPHDIEWDRWMVGTQLMGYYEREVQPAVITLIARRPRTIYNIGCASGYYAIGFARHLGETMVYAFDINEKSLEICREYAEKNGVGDRVITKKGIEHIPDLPKSIPESLYIVDTEGWEEFFFPKGEDFLASDLLIECHHRLENLEALVPVIDVLLPRFEKTHQVTVIKPANCHVLFKLGIEWPMLTQYSTLVDTRPQGHCWLLALSKRDARLEPPKAS